MISEAVVNGVPVLASRIDGNIGLLGRNYPALFDVGDTGALAALMSRIEHEATFYQELKGAIGRLAPLFNPRLELETWRELLRELGETGAAGGI